MFLNTDWTISMQSMRIIYFLSFYFQLCFKKFSQNVEYIPRIRRYLECL